MDRLIGTILEFEKIPIKESLATTEQYVHQQMMARMGYELNIDEAGPESDIGKQAQRMIDIVDAKLEIAREMIELFKQLSKSA